MSEYLKMTLPELQKEHADYVHRVRISLAQLDSFIKSEAGMNSLIRSVESTLEALRGES